MRSKREKEFRDTWFTSWKLFFGNDWVISDQMWELKDIIQQDLIDKVDHKHLNHDVDFLQGIIPTAENLSVAFWSILKNKIPNGELVELKLYETERNMALYKGEE